MTGLTQSLREAVARWRYSRLTAVAQHQAQTLRDCLTAAGLGRDLATGGKFASEVPLTILQASAKQASLASPACPPALASSLNRTARRLQVHARAVCPDLPTVGKDVCWLFPPWESPLRSGSLRSVLGRNAGRLWPAAALFDDQGIPPGPIPATPVVAADGLTLAQWQSLGLAEHERRLAMVSGWAPNLLRSHWAENLGGPLRLLEILVLGGWVIGAGGLWAGPGITLFTDTGLYFEWLPVDRAGSPDWNAARKALRSSDATEPGRDYLPVVTTLNGAVRTVWPYGVRWLSHHPPRLLPLGRLSARLHAAGEAVWPRDLEDAVALLCQRHHWRLQQFHVAPHLRPPSVDRPQRTLRHEWWIELDPACRETPISKTIAAELDHHLRQAVPTYDRARTKGALAPPWVCLLTPGTFAELSPGRPFHCPSLPDTSLADRLRERAKFHQEDES